MFLELGIRSALDKPVCLVWDGLDALPFDSGTLNTHKYGPMPVYDLRAEIDAMAEHIAATVQKSDSRNALWKFFGSAVASLPTATLKPEDATLLAKIDRLTDLVQSRAPLPPWLTGSIPANEMDAVVAAVAEALDAAGADGVHGATVRKICESHLGAAYPHFVGDRTLSGTLRECGIDVRTESKGRFVLGKYL